MYSDQIRVKDLRRTGRPPHKDRIFKKKYQEHKGRARRCNIAFLLSFEEWFKIWKESGHLHERGSRRGQYVMARFNDIGPYAIGNIKIITTEKNVSEANLGKEFTPSHKLRIGRAHLGMKRSTETRSRIRLAKVRYYYELRNGRG